MRCPLAAMQSGASAWSGRTGTSLLARCAQPCGQAGDKSTPLPRHWGLVELDDFLASAAGEAEGIDPGLGQTGNEGLRLTRGGKRPGDQPVGLPPAGAIGLTPIQRTIGGPHQAAPVEAEGGNVLPSRQLHPMAAGMRRGRRRRGRRRGWTPHFAYRHDRGNVDRTGGGLRARIGRWPGERRERLGQTDFLCRWCRRGRGFGDGD